MTQSLPRHIIGNLTIYNLTVGLCEEVPLNDNDTYLLIAGDDDHYSGIADARNIQGVLVWLLDNPNGEEVSEDNTMPITLYYPFTPTTSIKLQFSLQLNA